MGIENSAAHETESRRVATSQIPFQSSLMSSRPTSCASHIAPFGFVRNRNAPRRSRQLSMRIVILSSDERSASRRNCDARTAAMSRS